jgi:hypothetical protein
MARPGCAYLSKKPIQAQVCPVRTRDGPAEKDQEHDQDNQSAANATARAAPTKAKTVLQVVKGGCQQKEPQQAFKTSTPVAHTESSFPPLDIAYLGFYHE